MTQGIVHQSIPPESVDRETVIIDLISTYRATLLARVLRLTGGDHDWAEDIVQETFVRAWRHADRMTPARGNAGGWLMRVAHNLAMDDYRSARVRQTEVGADQAQRAIEDMTPALADESDRVLTAIVLEQALATLWPEHRAALVELYLHDRTPAQAAAVLGIPVGTVKSRSFYGLRRIRSVVDRAALTN